MKKIFKRTLIFSLILFILYLIVSFIFVFMMQNNTNQQFFEQKDYNSFSTTIENQTREIKVDDKKFIYHYFKNKDSKKTIVLTHGITVNKNYVTPVAKELYSKGYNVVLYDLRHHGENKSVGTMPSFSNFESDDLLKIIKDMKNKNSSENISLYGVSMGAATTTAYAQKYDNLNLVQSYIAESSFSSMYSQVNEESKKTIPFGISFFSFGINIWLKVLHNYTFDDSNLETNMSKIKHKFLFISPKNDPRINSQNSIDLAKKGDPNFVESKLFEGDKHASSFELKNKDEYFNILLDFYNKTLK